MVDESRDISTNEQMAVILRYVDNKGQVIERFMGFQHVTETTSSKLKEFIDEFLKLHDLSYSNLRGQGYDGASNMRAKKNSDVAAFFTLTNSLVNVVGCSCKRRDALREKQQENLLKAIENDCLETGQGLNQETSLKRAGDTRWNSHYGALISLITMFSSVVDVLDMIVKDCYNDSVGEAKRLLKDLQSFEFVFLLFLMKSILGVTNDLSQALQKKDQEIVNAMALVKTCKEQLRCMRNDENFDILVDKVSSFCVEHEIEVPNMDDLYVIQGKSLRKAPRKTNCFFEVIDFQLTELDDRFAEGNTELLICLACLNPNDSFVAFDKEKLVRLAHMYPKDFTDRDRSALQDQLDIYIHFVRSDNDFSQLRGINELAKKMVEKGLHRTFAYVYLLVQLALVLPVATASVERAFSAMNIIKGPLRNKMGDQCYHGTFSDHETSSWTLELGFYSL
ncbi:zinc finger MYM-type protein 1-like [Pyrus x bretschneideri]|uniref:zinc finger MYM-type protein 1-like n=1 Tax=Pyrus x bretschneideri TaxID=225117 RepID=UPI00202E9BF6|nr:zinc finger MYM-type protein 1-like [Pyrus x bretschneideri]